jgi:hypothetical protein
MTAASASGGLLRPVMQRCRDESRRDIQDRGLLESGVTMFAGLNTELKHKTSHHPQRQGE